MAPSAIPCPFCSQIDQGTVPRKLTVQEAKKIIDDFAKAALRAKLAGFDAVEVHGAHGYLIHEFLSPLANKRNDDYGGNFKKRMRFVLEVIEKIRQLAGDFPIICRMSGEDAVDGGITIEESKRIAVELEKAGVNAISVSSGTYQSLHKCLAPIYYPQGFLIPLAEEIKKVVKVPVMGVGRISNLALAEEILSGGKADLVAIGRALIADPELVNKSKSGKDEDIRPCIYCNFCSMDRLLSLMQMRCAVNVEAGQEAEYALEAASVSKNVLVIGGGPGGMEAARTAALRGHKVKLVERAEKMGGQLRIAAVPPFKEEVQTLIDYLSVQMRKAGVEVELGKEVTAEDVIGWSPDAVILATGASAYIPEVPGVENAITAVDVLKGEKVEGTKVIIVGGGFVGCETALYLAEKGKQVTIVEMLDDIAADVELCGKSVLMERIGEKRIIALTGRKMIRINKKGITVESKRGEKEEYQADTVVLALGLKSNRRLIEDLKGKITELYEIGDCTKPGRVHNAIHEAARVARRI